MSILVFSACESSREENEKVESKESLSFNSKQWKEKKLDEYPFRPLMYEEVLYSDSVRTLSKSEVLKMLGNPDKEENNHLYYTIERNAIGSWTLKQKSLIVKFRSDNSVEWIKLYE